MNLIEDIKLHLSQKYPGIELIMDTKTNFTGNDLLAEINDFTTKALKNMESSSRIMSAERTYSENDMRKCWQACVESFNDCYAPNLEKFLSEYAT